MKSLVLPCLASVVIGLCGSETALAHGGTYRGPGDIVPPGGYGPGGTTPGPRGGRTPGPRGPVTPRPGSPASGSGASTPGPATPGGGRSGPRTGGGIQLGDDFTRWVYWWEYNKDSFIRLRDALNAGRPVTGGDDWFMGHSKRVDGTNRVRPTELDIVTRVVPKLVEALESTDNRDITSACMIALAKIGMQGKVELLPLFRARLKSGDQEIRETAALAMGISLLPGGTPDLIALVRDTDRGRELVGRASVDHRTRSFAAYGLGLVANATSRLPLKRRIFEALRTVLEDPQTPGFNLKVAAIQGMRQLNLPHDGDASSAATLAECVDCLESYYQRDLGQGEQLVQAHVPTAIATLLGRTGPGAERFKEKFAAELSSDMRRRDVLHQSAALALGGMAQPVEASRVDGICSDALLRYYREGKDRQTRYFAVISLAQIGGNQNRTNLLKILDKAKHLDRPWAALALGVLAFDARKNDPDTSAAHTVGRALQRALADEASPENRAAIAIALGLCQYRSAAPDLRKLLDSNKHQDELAGYLCLGLALMDDQESKEPIRSLLETSVRRPDRLKQAAIALGKLGDFSVSTTLREQITSEHMNVAKLAAISKALGLIGDRRTLDPLGHSLFDTQLTPLSRAFVAVALGSIGDMDDLPWNSRISTDLNYRAAVETLVNQVSGVLDIL